VRENIIQTRTVLHRCIYGRLAPGCCCGVMPGKPTRLRYCCSSLAVTRSECQLLELVRLRYCCDLPKISALPYTRTRNRAMVTLAVRSRLPAYGARECAPYLLDYKCTRSTSQRSHRHQQSAGSRALLPNGGPWPTAGSWGRRRRRCPSRTRPCTVPFVSVRHTKGS